MKLRMTHWFGAFLGGGLLLQFSACAVYDPSTLLIQTGLQVATATLVTEFVQTLFQI